MISKLKPKSEFTRNVLTLMTGTTIAQAIPIAISPILTRIYTPEDFGVFALYTSTAYILAIAATGRYELAIMLPKKEEDAVNIMVLSIMISFLVSFIALLIVWFFNEQITSLVGNKEISNWLYFIPLTVLFTGLYQVLNYWVNRKKQYKRLAISKVAQNIGLGSVNIGMGYGGVGAGGLILGPVVGQGVAITMLSKMVWKEDSKLLKYVSKEKIYTLIKKYKNQPLLNLPNAIIDGFRLSGINILIAKFFTASVLGQFSLAWKMIQAPMSLVGASLSQVFFQKVSHSARSDLYPIVKKFIVKAIMVAAPIFLVIFIFAEDIFIFAFGENWKMAGVSASIMTPWLFLNFITSPLSSIFLVLNRQSIILIFSILYMVIPLGIIYLFNDLGYTNILKWVTFSMSLMLIVFIIMVLYLTKKENK